MYRMAATKAWLYSQIRTAFERVASSITYRFSELEDHLWHIISRINLTWPMRFGRQPRQTVDLSYPPAAFRRSVSPKWVTGQFSPKIPRPRHGVHGLAFRQLRFGLVRSVSPPRLDGDWLRPLRASVELIAA